MSRNSRGRDSDYSRDDRRSRYSEDYGSRVCIANINAKNLTEREVYDWMSRYGRVQDVAFFERQILVQFERETEAKKAIDREKGQSYRGNRYDIRIAHASDGNLSSQRRTTDSRGRSPQRSQPYNRDSRDLASPSLRERSPADRNAFKGINSDRHADSPDLRRGDRSRPPADNRQVVPIRDAPDVNFQSAPFTDQLTTERPGFDAAIIVMSSELLRYAETIEAKLQRQIALTTHIIVLKEEAHAHACIEDLTNKGVLYAFLVNQNNEIQNNCTLRILYGNPQEHRNMPLTRAFSFVSENFENYQKRVRDLKAIAPKPTFDPSRIPPGFVAPDDKIIYYCHLLADSRMLSIDELEKVSDFVNVRLQALAKAEGMEEQNEQTKSNPQLPKINQPLSAVPNSSSQPSNNEKVIALQNQLHSRLNNILKPQSSVVGSVPLQSTMNNSGSNQLISNVNSILPDPSTFSAVQDQYAAASGTNSNNVLTPPKSTNTNFLQNPSVQQALDTLMHANQFNNRSNVPNQSGSQSHSVNHQEDSNSGYSRSLMPQPNSAAVGAISNQYSMGNKPGIPQVRPGMMATSYPQQYPQVQQPMGSAQNYYSSQSNVPSHPSGPQMPHQSFPGHPQQPFYRGRPPFGAPRQPQYPHGGSSY